MRLDGGTSSLVAGSRATIDDVRLPWGMGQKAATTVSELLPYITNACIYRHGRVELKYQPIRSGCQSDAGAE